MILIKYQTLLKKVKKKKKEDVKEQEYSQGQIRQNKRMQYKNTLI